MNVRISKKAKQYLLSDSQMTGGFYIPLFNLHQFLSSKHFSDHAFGHLKPERAGIDNDHILRCSHQIRCFPNPSAPLFLGLYLIELVPVREYGRCIGLVFASPFGKTRNGNLCPLFYRAFCINSFGNLIHSFDGYKK